MSIEIIGAQEYKQLLELYKNDPLCGNEIHTFHPTFVKILNKKVDVMNNFILLDYVENFSEFPTNQGIYFCARSPLFTSNCEIWYVGKAGNFRNRWKNHHKLEALKALKNVGVFCLTLDHYSKDEIATAERIYIEMLKPVFNNTSKPEKHLRVAS